MEGLCRKKGGSRELCTKEKKKIVSRLSNFFGGVCVCSVSRAVMSDSLWSHGLYVAHQAPLSMRFSRQEYWNGLPFPSPGDLPDPGIEPGSPMFQADPLPSEPSGQREWQRVHVYVCVRECFKKKYCNMVDLQSCASFRCIVKWIVIHIFTLF